MAIKYNLKRPIERKVRFSHEENEYINKKIAASPFDNFQNFARILLISGEVKIVDYSQLKKLNGEIRRIGNNINQIAKLAHQFEEISEQDIRDMTQVLKEIQQQLEEHLKQENKQERTI
ncbi:MobC family plasmid mobilization relaxosome protein [Enterococcus sp. AZ012]|uniref:MobC family plasmid mobilization relaxosome protein n=1 Tax=unclassified Enterococcus TaxID=2608891 RepID=UPI003D29A56A